ncbi:MAG TPA: hypothetical protein VMV51_11990 [Gemmatimonadaceae bacterium]|nr:hypothetical protein [Gemmatimonadaceae bacterium]
MTAKKDEDVIEGFEFIDGDRTFTCSVEKAPAVGNEAWWWFTVSTDDRQRYAPFRATARDTQKAIRARIVAYYDELLERRAAPATPYWRRGPQQNAQAKPAVPAVVEAPVPAKDGKAPKVAPAVKAAKPAKAAAKPAKQKAVKAKAQPVKARRK